MFIAVLLVTSLIMLIGPFVLGSFLIRRLHTTWMLFILGAATFLTAQTAHSLLFSQVQQTEFYTSASAGSPVYVLLMYGFTLALVQLVIRYLAIWVGNKYLQNQTRPWGGILTLAAGYGSGDVVLSFGLNSLLLMVSVITFPQSGPVPESMTPDQFASNLAQVQNLLSMPFLKLLLYSQLFLGFSLFALEVAAMLMTWVGVIQKSWVWYVASLLWQTAMTGAIILSFNWMNLYLSDDKVYAINLFAGMGLVLFLIAINLGVVYLVYKYIRPLMNPEVLLPPTPLKPVVVQQSQPKKLKTGKKLKNTDLK